MGGVTFFRFYSLNLMVSKSDLVYFSYSVLTFMCQLTG